MAQADREYYEAIIRRCEAAIRDPRTDGVFRTLKAKTAEIARQRLAVL